MKINVSARPRKNAFLGKTQYMMAVAANYSSIGAGEVVDELSQKIQMPKEQIENALMCRAPQPFPLQGNQGCAGGDGNRHHLL